MDNLPTLSKKETKIIASLSMGFLYKEIAADYSISINTVKKHVKSIYRKLEVTKRHHAVEKFFSQSRIQQMADIN